MTDVADKVGSSDGQLMQSLASYETIDYRDIQAYMLLDRVDTKYIMTTAQFEHILSMAAADYKLVTYDGAKSSNCANRYYDTPQFQCYLNHHRGKRIRYKVRIRSYVDSGLEFMEVKTRKSVQRTLKTRVPYIDQTAITDEYYHDLLDTTIGTDKELEHKLNNSFNRVTLVNKETLERITIDTRLSYELGGRSLSYNNLVIMEVKSPGKSTYTSMSRLLGKMNIRSTSISKYCIGISNLYPKLKSNNFKIIQRKISAING